MCHVFFQFLFAHLFVFYSFQGTREVKRIRGLGGQSGGGVYSQGLIREKKKIGSQLSPVEKVMTKHVNSSPSITGNGRNVPLFK